MAEEQNKAQAEEQVELQQESEQAENVAEGVVEGVVEGDAGDSAEPDLAAQLEAARQEAADAKEQALRAAAEAQNVRRRAEKDAENARKYALEKFAADVLVVADNLDRALAAADTENEELKPLIEGVELTRKAFVDALARHKVEQIDPAGQPFDPEFHEAMAMVPNPDVEPNTVIDVMQKGYTLNGRLLRAAMVVVAKAAE
ncbi:MAG: nucleotide exchange factor GrpE [Spongiibacter sp.]|uniref:Protein GrpE n=1 Tax=Spongiibacter thalassae TaxID=2721624 RepID=A0ABX1GLR8_9GAMM|nr:nucleotide exchange factor GrpE [Spongiibacter thalassae]